MQQYQTHFQSAISRFYKSARLPPAYSCAVEPLQGLPIRSFGGKFARYSPSSVQNKPGRILLVKKFLSLAQNCNAWSVHPECQNSAAPTPSSLSASLLRPAAPARPTSGWPRITCRGSFSRPGFSGPSDVSIDFGVHGHSDYPSISANAGQAVAAGGGLRIGHS